MPLKQPVIYLPGIDGTGRLLFRQEELLSRFDVHCLSYPQDDRHTYPELVAIGQRTLYRVGPAILLAESFGGGVAMKLALACPDLVRKLVLVNTFANYPRRLFIDLLALVGPWLPWWPPPRATRTFRGSFFGACTPREVRREFWNRTADVPLRAYGHRFRLLSQLDLRSQLAQLCMPAVVFISPNDWVVPAVAGRLLAKKLPHARLISIPSRHASLVDDRVNVADWLAADEHSP